ncbi:MAG: hypothetical protein GY850_11045, partial [bacterium]|nr:hypothetical protein [bacterium]
SFRRNFLASIYEHGRFIKNTLEKDPPATNHYLAGITGLLFIALYCPFFKESGAWKRFCIAELESEIKKQVYSDGCSFEGSTSYHRLALELFFYAAFFAEKAGTVFSPAYHKMLKKMFRFSLYCIKPDGNIPQIGDNDNSRFLVFSARPVLDHTYLLSLAAIYFRDSDFKLRSFPYDEEAFWLFGKVGRETWQGLPCRDSELCSRAFPVAGWYIMRHADNYCFISCGPNGQNGKGGHNHNDKLSFELMLSGEDVVIDPGTYAYTSSPEWRSTFRSTAYHNTLKIDKREQGCISGDLFETQSAVECMPCKLRESRDRVEFEGEIKYSENAGTHKRTIVLEKNTGVISIVDDVKNRLPGNVLMSFCLGPSALKYH